MYAYNNQKNPAEPIVPITIFPPSGVQKSPITLFILADTGADYTCLPLNIFFSLNHLPNGRIHVQGVIGSGQVNLYSVYIEFHNRLFPSCSVVELPQGAQALLGRDIMNAFRLEFNGPSNYLGVL
jgi:hypothetical protein